MQQHHLPALQPGADLTGAFVVTLPGGTHDPARIMLEKLRQHIDIMACRPETHLFCFGLHGNANST
jgi:hypothetical protein